MVRKVLQLTAVVLTAVSMTAGWAHLLALPNKVGLSREDYFTVQQIYRGWALLGIVVVGGLLSTAALTVLERGKGAPFRFALAASLCVALSLVVFFSFTFPANVATQNWTVQPGEWEAFRRQWEYSHAVGALLYLGALVTLVLSIITDRR